MTGEEFITAEVVLRETGIPRSAFYRLVAEGKIRSHPLPLLPHHQRQQYRFRLSEVREDLDRLPKSKGLQRRIAEDRPPYA